jgi:hypothetical protein
MEGKTLIPPGGTGGLGGRGGGLGAIERMTSMAASDEIASVGNQLFPTDLTLIMKSDLPDGLILPLIRAKTIQRMSKSKVLDGYMNDLLASLVSKNRKGREELLKALYIVKSSQEEEGGL